MFGLFPIVPSDIITPSRYIFNILMFVFCFVYWGMIRIFAMQLRDTAVYY